MRSTDGRRSTYRRTGNWALGGRPLCRRDPGPAYRGHVSVRAQWLAMESLATLGLWASGGTARHVTASLGISPTRCVEPGEPIRPGCTKIAEARDGSCIATSRVPTSNSMNPSAAFSTRSNDVPRLFVNSSRRLFSRLALRRGNQRLGTRHCIRSCDTSTPRFPSRGSQA